MRGLSNRVVVVVVDISVMLESFFIRVRKHLYIAFGYKRTRVRDIKHFVIRSQPARGDDVIHRSTSMT